MLQTEILNIRGFQGRAPVKQGVSLWTMEWTSARQLDSRFGQIRTLGFASCFDPEGENLSRACKTRIVISLRHLQTLQLSLV